MFTASHRFSTVRMILVLAVILGTFAVRPGRAAPQSFDYIVFERYADGTIQPVFYSLVEMTTPPRSLTDNELAQALDHTSRADEQLAVALQTNDGQIVYQNNVRISPWLRGEFHGVGSDAPIDGHLMPLEVTSFVVRVPHVEGTTLLLQNASLESLGQFDTEVLSRDTAPIELLPTMQTETVSATSGPASNREDFLIMGDGYTSGQSTKFANDAAAVSSAFFSIPPYSTYSNYYNVHTLFTASAQSGADHPPYSSSCAYNDPTCCGDSEMQSDPLRGVMVSTAFDSRFCANWIHRLLVGNTSKILAAAAAVPDWDSILLIVNDTTYGGSGGLISVISMSSYAPEIAQHEYGHSFIGLADEYNSPYPGYPTCSDSSGNMPCEANVTNVTNRSQIKWKPWIDSDTPIPTPNQISFQNIVGLFQGARYRSTGMYRSGYSCIMRSLGAPFCQVPSQAYVLRLYSGISLIEPDGISPVSQQIFLTHPTSQTFEGTTLSPVGGPPVQITWLENGVPIPNQTNASFTYTSSADKSGWRYITLRVKDQTSLVMPSMAGNALQDEFTWAVAVDISGAPAVTSSRPANPSPTKAATVDFTVTFSEAVDHVDKDDFLLVHTGVTGASILSVSGSGNTYVVKVGTGLGNGTLRLDVLDDDSMRDVMDEPLGGAGLANGNFTAGESYTVIKTVPAIPALLAPANGAVVGSLQPTLDWKDVAGVGHYQLQVATNSAFSTLVIDEPNLSASTFTPGSDFTPGQVYYWRIKALNILNQSRGWSDKWSFKMPLAQTTLVSPVDADSLLTDRPAFDWDSVQGASQYILQVSAVSNFSTLLVNVTVAAPEYSMTKDLPQNKTLHWRVRAKTPAVVGPWSAKWSFKTGNPATAPVLVAPTNGALLKDYTPEFNWNNSTTPKNTTFTRYEIQLDDNKEFSSPETYATTSGDIKDSDFTPLTDLASNTKYYWRVRSVNTVDVVDHTSGWSSVWSFRTVIPAPQSLLMTPNDVQPLQPSFSWDAATGSGVISGYTIQISTSSTFSTLIVNSTTQNLFYNMTKNLPAHKTIYWRVRINGANGPSAWSKDQFITP